MNHEENQVSDSITYIQHEINRLQTIAGTLSTVESRHFKELTDIGDNKLTQIAVEEQNAARQLGEVKQICLALAQRVEDLQNQLNQ
jgi:hypothetical protein